MTHRGPFQPLPFCDSVTSSEVLGAAACSAVFLLHHLNRCSWGSKADVPVPPATQLAAAKRGEMDEACTDTWDPSQPQQQAWRLSAPQHGGNSPGEASPPYTAPVLLPAPTLGPTPGPMEAEDEVPVPFGRISLVRLRTPERCCAPT